MPYVSLYKLVFSKKQIKLFHQYHFLLTQTSNPRKRRVEAVQTAMSINHNAILQSVSLFRPILGCAIILLYYDNRE